MVKKEALTQNFSSFAHLLEAESRVCILPTFYN
jgi:hypothetical protein